MTAKQFAALMAVNVTIGAAGVSKLNTDASPNDALYIDRSEPNADLPAECDDELTTVLVCVGGSRTTYTDLVFRKAKMGERFDLQAPDREPDDNGNIPQNRDMDTLCEPGLRALLGCLGSDLSIYTDLAVRRVDSNSARYDLQSYKTASADAFEAMIAAGKAVTYQGRVKQ